MQEWDLSDLQLKSIQYRESILTMIKEAGAGHIGGSLSCIDILNVLYNRVMRASPDRFGDPDADRYIHSKGHSVEALYAVLASRGYFHPQDLRTLNRYQSGYIGHPTRHVPGIEQNTGALGHGLPVAVGLALAARLDHRPARVYVLLGDGELAEGANWEASLTAAQYRLENLVAIVDRNGLQITGRTEDVCALEPLRAKFESFGYAVRCCDGHNLAELDSILHAAPFETGRPNLLLAHTTKGKGISFMENNAQWHHRVPTDEEYLAALRELQQAQDEKAGSAR